MKYPRYIVDMAYYAMLAEELDADQTSNWNDISLECLIYEAETGADRELGFESNWEEDLLSQVEQIYGYHKPE